MRVTVRADQLVRELGLLQRASAKKGAVPAYSCARLEAVEGSLLLQATDGRMSARSAVEAAAMSPVVAGVAVVPLDRLRELADTCGKDHVDLSLDGAHLALAGSGLKARLQGMAAEEFPQVPVPPTEGTVPLTAGPLRRLLALTRYAISRKDDSRYSITGASVELEAKTVRLIATDGHRLATAVSPRPEGPATLPQCILPREAVELALAMLDGAGDGEPVTLSVDEGRVFLEAGARTLGSAGLEGTFPSWRRVLPKPGTPCSVVADALRLALRRARVVTDDKGYATLQLEPGRLVVQAESQEVGNAAQALEVIYDGPPVTVGVFTGQVSEFLEAAQAERVVLEASAPDKPIVWRAAGDVATDYVQMPVVR